MKTFEQFRDKNYIVKRAMDIIDIDKKNSNFGETRITEDDPYGEELWETENKEDVVKENLYKALTNRVGVFGEKPVYDVFLKTEKNNYYLIGWIKYISDDKLIMSQEDRYKRLKYIDDNIKNNKSLPMDIFIDFKNSLKKKTMETERVEKINALIYTDIKKRRDASNNEINKMKKINEEEYEKLSKDLSSTLYSGNINIDMNTNVTHYDEFYYMIKEK